MHATFEAMIKRTTSKLQYIKTEKGRAHRPEKLEETPEDSSDLFLSALLGLHRCPCPCVAHVCAHSSRLLHRGPSDSHSLNV